MQSEVADFNCSVGLGYARGLYIGRSTLFMPTHQIKSSRPYISLKINTKLQSVTQDIISTIGLRATVCDARSTLSLFPSVPYRPATSTNSVVVGPWRSLEVVLPSNIDPVIAPVR